MPISIAPVIPPQGAAPVSLDQVLQPGAVIEARVLAQLEGSLARILIANTAIEVTTQTPLVPGMVLRLTVSQAADGGLRLATTPAVSTPPATPATPAHQDSPLPRVAAAPDHALIALAQATRQAAPRQSGLSPLFADVTAALEQGQLPPQVRAAIAPLLALRPQLSAGVTAPQLQKALQQSGLLLESSVAAGRAPHTQAPDLKAALIVLRQVLSQWQGALSQGAMAPAPSMSAAPVQTMPAQMPVLAMPPQTMAGVLPQTMPVPVTPPPATPPTAAQPAVPIASQPLPAPPLVPDEFIVPLATPQRANTLARPVPALRAQTTGVALALLQELAQGAPDLPVAANAVRADSSGTSAVATRDPRPVTPDAPPPPYRGAPPSAQPVSLPSVKADDAPPVVAHKLLDDVDGALARQTLLQIASLPEQPLPPSQRSEQPRWAFEIPFATPQGTAVAQFEISRDGKSAHQAEEVKRIWRARFSLNVEPAGPVHAVIALSGERASVRLWADRPETIARLRDSVPLLSHALREAELDPGEIAVGRPPSVAQATTGQFWNQAS